MLRLGRSFRLWLIGFVLFTLILPFLMRNTILGGRDWSKVESVPTAVRLAERKFMVAETSWQPDPHTGGLLLSHGYPVSPGQNVFFRWTMPWSKDLAEPFPGLDLTSELFGPWGLSVNGRWILVGASPYEKGTTALLWDREQHIARRFEWKFHPLVSIQPTGGLAALAHYQPAETKLMDLGTGALLATVPHVPTGIDGRALTWHPTESTFVMATHEGVILIAEKDGTWQTRVLATEKRDFASWQARVHRGEAETGYYPAEMPYVARFFAEGAFLAVAMDQGLRVYALADLLAAVDRLPAPKWSFDSELVPVHSSILRRTYDVDFDRKRGWLIWTGLAGKIEALDVETGNHRTIFRFPKNVVATRLAILGKGDVLACQVSLGMFESRPDHRLLLLDLASLSETEFTEN